ncbi:hypothetical protein SAMN05421504_11071 [Amycolatopsis xylanica]|uniref:PASTA domain-containing protein n=1 Tax=Amycolatopsis xylanica TaxID=589385 RepID=A0A1H3QST1_9PSEU|nr:PASTA domain-containing protein [Amycolatopsis xylanica]SDZ16574.1 hypothetical protein SAMN05421504_11071 [Amycolatopsis xylanica]
MKSIMIALLLLPPMPDVVGKTVVEAYDQIGWQNPVHVRDISGDDRPVLWPAHWKVCAQRPAAGAPVKRYEPVELDVVKLKEPCPKPGS